MPPETEKGIMARWNAHDFIRTHKSFFEGLLPQFINDSILDLRALQATSIPVDFLENYIEYLDGRDIWVNGDAARRALVMTWHRSKRPNLILITVILPTAVEVVHESAFNTGWSDIVIEHIDMAHCINLWHVGRAAFCVDPEEASAAHGLKSLVFPTGANITLGQECFLGNPLRQIAWGSVVHILHCAFSSRRDGYVPPNGRTLKLECLDFSNTRVSFIGKHAFVQDAPCDYLRFDKDVIVTNGTPESYTLGCIDGIPGKTIVMHAEAMQINCKNIILPCYPPDTFLVRQVDRFGHPGISAPITQFIKKNPDARLLNNTYVNTYYYETVMRPHETAYKKDHNPKYTYEPARAAALDTLFAKYPDNFGKLRAVVKEYAINTQTSVDKNTKQLPQTAGAEVLRLVLPFTFSDMTF